MYRALPAWQARSPPHIQSRASPSRTSRTLRSRAGGEDHRAALLLTGGDSPDLFKDDIDVVEAALPDARIVVIEGQQHIAIDLVPAVFAEHVLAFLHDQR